MTDLQRETFDRFWEKNLRIFFSTYQNKISAIEKDKAVNLYQLGLSERSELEVIRGKIEERKLLIISSITRLSSIDVRDEIDNNILNSSFGRLESIEVVLSFFPPREATSEGKEIRG